MKLFTYFLPDDKNLATYSTNEESIFQTPDSETAVFL